MTFKVPSNSNHPMILFSILEEYIFNFCLRKHLESKQITSMQQRKIKDLGFTPQTEETPHILFTERIPHSPVQQSMATGTLLLLLSWPLLH